MRKSRKNTSDLSVGLSSCPQSLINHSVRNRFCNEFTLIWTFVHEGLLPTRELDSETRRIAMVLSESHGFDKSSAFGQTE